MANDDELKQKPRLTLDEYIGLRNRNPGWSRPLSLEREKAVSEILSDPDSARMLAKFGVDCDKLKRVLLETIHEPMGNGCGDVGRYVDELSIQLLGAIQKNQQVAKKMHRGSKKAYVRSGDLLADSLINVIALALLEQIVSLSIDLPDALISLIQIRLDEKLADPNPRSDMRNSKAKAIVTAAIDPAIAGRSLARKVGVDQKTASAWKKEEWFTRQTAKLSRGTNLRKRK